MVEESCPRANEPNEPSARKSCTVTKKVKRLTRKVLPKTADGGRFLFRVWLRQAGDFAASLPPSWSWRLNVASCRLGAAGARGEFVGWREGVGGCSCSYFC